MASTEDPFRIRLSNDEMKDILEKYRQTAKNICEGGLIAHWTVFANLMKVGHLHKDLELEGMQTVTKSSNFLACVQQAADGCSDVFQVIEECFYDGSDEVAAAVTLINNYQTSRDIGTLTDIFSQYNKLEGRCENTLKYFRKVKELLAEVYTRYFMTRGPLHDQVIEALAAVRQTLLSVEASVIYICSLLKNVQQLSDKFYIHATFINELVPIASVEVDFSITSNYDRLINTTSTKFGEQYLKFESKCMKAEEELKTAVDEGGKRLQARLHGGLP